MPSRVRRLLIALVCAISLLVPVAVAAGPSLPIGSGPCAGSPGVDDRCEAWTSSYHDDIAASSSQFLSGIAISPDDAVLYAAVKTTTGTGFDSRSQWAIVATDAATGERLWVSKWGDPDLYSFPTSVAVSPDGSLVFATGTTRTEFVDPDGHMTTIAFDAQSGDIVWRSTYDGPGDGTDNGRELLVAPDGSAVYVVAVSDSFPGQGEDLTYAILGYDTHSGAELWATRWNGIGTPDGTDSPFDAVISPDGSHLYATGWSAGPGEFNLDYGTISVSTGDGSVAWEARYDGVGVHAPDEAFAIAIDPTGSKVFVSGLSDDVDGGPPFEANYGFGTVAYDATTGNQLWDTLKIFPDTFFNSGNAAAVSANGKTLFVTGESTIKSPRDVGVGTVAYDTTSGDELWSDRYGLPDYDLELANAATTIGNDVYVAGISSSSSTSKAFLDKGQIGDQLVLAYDGATGTRDWTARWNFSGYDFDNSTALVASNDGKMLFSGADLKHNIATDQNFYDAGLSAYAVGDIAPSPSPSSSSTTSSPTASHSPSPTTTSSPTPTKHATELAFTDDSAVQAQYSDSAVIKARLTSDGEPVVGRDVMFELTGPDGSRRFSNVTNGNGIATVNPVMEDRPGAYQLTARFAGDDGHGSSVDASGFVVDKEDTVTHLELSGNGSTRTLRARLLDPDSEMPIDGRRYDFYGDGNAVGSATTGSDGWAQAEVRGKDKGAKVFEARFDGDDFYKQSSDRVTR